MNRETFFIVLSFATIYIVWGSTYLFSDFAVQEIDAFRVCTIRFIPASMLAFLLAAFLGKPILWQKKEIINSLIAGFTFLGLGTGGAIWSLNHLDSGFSALIISGEPLIIVLLIWLIKKSKPAGRTLFGIALGMIGMYLLISQQELISSPSHWIGILAIFLSMLAWGLGSIFVSGASLPQNQFFNIGIQLGVGGITCYVISLILGEDAIAFGGLSQRAIFSIAFLIVFGSIAAFTAFNYLLKKVSTEKVVTNTYVNPIIAMILGYLYNNEVVTSQSVISAVILLSGVFIINSRKALK